MKNFLYVQFSCWLIICAGIHPAAAQDRFIKYVESKADILNPERGFYIPLGTKAGNFVPLDAARLKSYRSQDQFPHGATYPVRVSLLYRAYELDEYKTCPLPTKFLIRLQHDLDVVRESGLKLVLRFAYINQSHSGDCKDQYDICPPYGDAPLAVVMRHIEQLRPILRKNADIIAVLQEGFIGIWGENYFTDYFGDASDHGSGRIPDSSWLHRNAVLKALLDAMPADRMVQVRTPQIKQKFVYGPHAQVGSAPLSATTAYSGSDASRIGFHNDCFLASADDYGTYLDNGSSVQLKGDANDALRKYIEADTRYTVVGGETCDDAFSPQNDCAPAGHAEDEMQRMHYSYLNASYNNKVNNDWDSAGCMYQIRRRLGYRLVLRDATLPQMLKRRDSLLLRLTIDNIGYAAPFNPRRVQLVLRSVSSGREYVILLGCQPRSWDTGIHQVAESIKLPRGIGQGNYALFLCFPDQSPALRRRPEYCIRLANDDM